MGFLDDLGKNLNNVASVASEAASKVADEANKRLEDRSRQAEEERAVNFEQEAKIRELAKNVVVTTGDIRQDYDIIGPVYFQISNKGIFSSKFSKLAKKYEDDVKHLKDNNNSVAGEIGRILLLGEFSVGEDNFDQAFYIATEELKRKALFLGGDAVVHMRQDIDMDTDHFSFFYLQMYGTAVKIRK